ncbi:predicted protein [Chaetomium globosum CBS 148.51]|uniref:Uncharacterized protein n=1 Tax=Chaetomium globosum (strain ATCC 6205 / CBS 148.51 / DSM 1962 / NBRC 6347 / NRRL 1970) TaxID=306901 RepID=Q2GQV3_CHAGB|nr:uncharacterized protein CHGG_09651 [Chaetomium globosum CBS 148.51]EAQ83247.1 predicted protein [Chaetomium globosum CBS 148.51]
MGTSVILPAEWQGRLATIGSPSLLDVNQATFMAQLSELAGL